jgi:hypothetical protein
MMMRTRRTMRAKALQTDRLICIDPDCMIVVINETRSTCTVRSTRGDDRIFRVRVGLIPNTTLCRGMLILRLRR